MTGVANFGFMDVHTPSAALTVRAMLQHSMDNTHWQLVADEIVSGANWNSSAWAAPWGVAGTMNTTQVTASGWYRVVMEATNDHGLSSQSVCQQQLLIDASAPSAVNAIVTVHSAADSAALSETPCVLLLSDVLRFTLRWSGFSSGECAGPVVSLKPLQCNGRLLMLLVLVFPLLLSVLVLCRDFSS